MRRLSVFLFWGGCYGTLLLLIGGIKLRQIVASYAKPEVVTIPCTGVKPCFTENRPEDYDFYMGHVFCIELFVEDSEDGSKKILGGFDCLYVNMESREDKELCGRHGYSSVINAVEQNGATVDNLAIVYSAAFSGEAAMNSFRLAFTKVYCIFCRIMAVCCQDGKNPGIYFDFSGMGSEARKMVENFLPAYGDGDVRADRIGADGIYVHKIPFNPQGRQQKYWG